MRRLAVTLISAGAFAVWSASALAATTREPAASRSPSTS